MGEKIKINNEEGEQEYQDALRYYQDMNTRLGYGSNKTDWDKKRYLEQRRKLKHLKEYARNLDNKKK